MLACNSYHFIPSETFSRQEGAYLYFDFNRGVFVQNGKVVRHGFKTRHSKHLSASKEEKSSTHFYFMYTLTKRKRLDKRDKLGCFEFEHLTQVIAAGFDHTQNLQCESTQGLQREWVINNAD